MPYIAIPFVFGSGAGVKAAQLYSSGKGIGAYMPAQRRHIVGKGKQVLVGLACSFVKGYLMQLLCRSGGKTNYQITLLCVNRNLAVLSGCGYVAGIGRKCSIVQFAVIWGKNGL